MRNIKGIIQYDGTGFKGWQIQKDPNTIQGIITETLKLLLKEPITVIASGRTDAGVHAIEQVISFKTLSDMNLTKLLKSMNALLHKQIKVLSLSEAPINFHPRYDTKMKTYIYFIYNDHFVSPFIRNYTWDLPIPLDVDDMIEASRHFIGKKDFSSFTCSESSKGDCVREIYLLDMNREDQISFMGFSMHGNFITIEITADGFLRHMVRNIVGTLVDVGRKKIPLESIPEIIKAKDRRLAGLKAPSKGLFLKKVVY